MRLEGKKIFVTGGASGIAAADVRKYVNEGAKVVSADINDEDGRKIVDEANKEGPGEAKYMHCDISKQEEVKKVVAEAVEWLGGLDVMANIAGVEGGCKAEDVTDEDMDFIFGVNIRGMVYTNQEAFRYMKDTGGGSIINYSSHTAINPYVFGSVYSMSKGAVMSWTRTVAHEWGKYGIRVNNVAPCIWTNMYDEYLERLDEAGLKAEQEDKRVKIPIGGKLGDPYEDLAPVMVFLASDDSHFVTAQIIPVDGGYMQTR